MFLLLLVAQLNRPRLLLLLLLSLFMMPLLPLFLPVTVHSFLRFFLLLFIVVSLLFVFHFLRVHFLLFVPLFFLDSVYLLLFSPVSFSFSTASPSSFPSTSYFTHSMRQQQASPNPTPRIRPLPILQVGHYILLHAGFSSTYCIFPHPSSLVYLTWLALGPQPQPPQPSPLPSSPLPASMVPYPRRGSLAGNLNISDSSKTVRKIDDLNVTNGGFVS